MPRGSLKTAMDELVAVEAALVPIVVDLGGTLETYRWWRPDMALPAIWNWLTPAETEREGSGRQCRVRDTLRVTVSIGVNPQAVPGEGDMLELEEYADLFRDLIDPVLYGRNPLGQRMARRRGFETATEELGGVPILTVEFPIEVELDRTVLTVP